jgi:hypothetical protein
MVESMLWSYLLTSGGLFDLAFVVEEPGQQE